MGIVLTGGTVVTAESVFNADIRVEGEKIAAIGLNLTQAGDRRQDVDGCLLFPGGIDPHTHFDLSVGETTTADDFASGSAAAVLGGTTTVIDFATQNKGESLHTALANWQAKAAGRSYIDYGFHLAITDWNEGVPAEMNQLVKSGVSSFKLYMAYKGTLQVDDGAIFRALLQSNRIGALLGIHCENGDVIEALVAEQLAKGHCSPHYHAVTRPAAAEREAVARVIALAEIARAPLYIVHLSTAEALQVIREARKRGVEVYAETCPQYLLLDDSLYGQAGFAGAKYVMSPPLRKPADQAALMRGLAVGEVDVVATDHCSFNFLGQKELGRDDFSKIPNGAPGVEHRLELLYSYGVLPGKVSLQQFVALTSRNAAKLFGLYPRKGTLAVGSDADIVVWNPRESRIISAKNQTQRVDYTPYEGMQVTGRAEHVFVRGQQVVAAGKLRGADPQGTYLARNPFPLCHFR